jgi:hypothetical protein
MKLKNIKLRHVFLFIVVVIIIFYYIIQLRYPFTEPMTPYFSDSFCKIHQTKAIVLEEKCGALTKSNCGNVSCCTWVSDKCVAADKNGPIYSTHN